MFAVPIARAPGADLLVLHTGFAGFTYGDGRLHSLTESEVVTRGGKSDVISQGQIRRIGIVYRRDIVNMQSRFATSTGFNGEHFWFSNPNGFAVPIAGDSAKRLLAEDLILTDAIATMPWTARGPDTVDTHSVGVYRIAKEPGLPIDIYVDDRTGAYRRAVIDPDGDHRVVLDILQYATVNGMKVISQWRSGDEDATHTLNDVSANAVISDPDLSPPPQIAQWQSIGAPAFPFKTTRNRIAVEAKVNGVQGLFVLGSGFAGTMISGRFAHRAGLNANGRVEATYGGFPESLETGTAETIDIAGNVLRGASVYFGFQNVDTRIPDGVLGYDLFAHSVVTLDFAKSTMRIEDPALVNTDGIGGIHMLADLGRGAPAVPARIQDFEVNALLDTSVPDPVVIPYGMVERHGLKLAPSNDSSGCWLLDVVTLASISYTRPLTCMATDFGDRQVVVGLPFLDNFAQIVFDYSRAGIVFVPKSTDPK